MEMRHTVVRTLTAGAGLVLLALGVVAPSASATREGSTGGSESGDYTAQTSVTYTGDGAPGGGGSYTIVVPATCWWSPLGTGSMGWEDVDPSDPEAVEEWFTEEVLPEFQGHADAGRLQWPETEVFQDAIERAQNGEDIVWYKVECRDGTTPVDEGYHQGVTEYQGTDIAVVNYPFVAGTEPEPAVDPEVLAEAAREDMVIDEPDVDRNPRAADMAGATLVNVPTWFWVTNPAAVGGNDGTRTIRAEIEGSPVYAEVTAQTGGLSVASPSGSAECPPAAALQEWSPGADDADGCTVRFSRASVGQSDGFTVSASTQWNATWQGQTQGGESVGGDLEPLSREATVNVPVAEVQAVVTTVNAAQ